MNPTKAAISTALVFLTGQLSAVTIISDNFNSGTLSADWSTKSTTTVAAGGPGGTGSYAAIPAEVNGLGDQIGGASSFVIDFDFRVQNSTSRQFNLGVMTASTTPNPGAAAINLRYEAGAWAVYGSSWNTVASLSSIAAGTWYHMQVEGSNWGTAAGNYTIRLFDAANNPLGSATLTTVQNGSITGPFTTTGTNPASFPGTAQAFLFTSLYGGNPGFDVDNVLVTATLVPEPAVSLIGTAGLALAALRRRRA